MAIPRRRRYTVLILVLTLIFVICRKELWLDALTSQEWSDFVQNDPTKHDRIVLNWTHLKLLGKRRADYNLSRTDHLFEQDCFKFESFRVQQTCSKRLRYTRSYCSKLQKTKRQNDVTARISVSASDRSYSNKIGRNVNIINGGVSGGNSHNHNENRTKVFSYRQGNTLAIFCSVHKVASTFWIRLFRFLHHDHGSSLVSTPEAISKYNVHLAPFTHSRPVTFFHARRTLLPRDEEFRFLFTRDPYRRLWSVYIDKFVLPDSYFWTVHAAVIDDKRFANDILRKPGRHSPTSCFDVSFPEFVEYVVSDQLRTHSDDHILPMSMTCNPCSFNPNFIGRLENMTDDSQAVLERLNLTHLTNSHNFQDRIFSQIRTITQFVYDIVIERGSLRHCVSNEELQTRLLNAFVFSGYMPPEVMQKTELLKDISLTRLLNMMKDLFLSFNRTRVEVEEQKNQYFINAYKSLPRTLLFQIKDYYRGDFESFGYDPEPYELFGSETQY